MTLAYVDFCQLLGEDDVMMNANYTTTVQCISEKASLLYIMKEDFMKLQTQTTQWNYLQDKIKEKQKKYM